MCVFLKPQSPYNFGLEKGILNALNFKEHFCYYNLKSTTTYIFSLLALLL